MRRPWPALGRNTTKKKFSTSLFPMDCASKSNTVFMQRSQSKILTAIANAPRYVTNHTLHTDFNIPYASDVIHERINKHHNKLEAHPNPLLQPLLQPGNTRRLKRCWPLDLQGTRCDIAGWIPYHVIVIHGIWGLFDRASSSWNKVNCQLDATS